jgi:hypothetical protein
MVLILQQICEYVLDFTYFWLLASLCRYNPQSDESVVTDKGVEICLLLQVVGRQ